MGRHLFLCASARGAEIVLGESSEDTRLRRALRTPCLAGYGDISPTTSPERIVGMVLMIVGCAFFAWITGKITQLMTQVPLPCERSMLGVPAARCRRRA